MQKLSDQMNCYIVQIGVFAFGPRIAPNIHNIDYAIAMENHML